MHSPVKKLQKIQTPTVAEVVLTLDLLWLFSTAVCRDLDSLSEFFEYKRIWDFEKIWMDMGVSPEVLHGFG
jgi:hypothetical protein